MQELDLETPLAPEEARVLGCLLEKERTTPDTYPLTLNALRSACNQTSNREPVVSYDDRTVQDALDRLRQRQLTRIVYSQSNRATKYRHVIDEALRLEDEDLAVLTVLLLRGAQTPGELRARTDRLHHFDDMDTVDATLRRLQEREPPLVVRLERRPGQKEARYAQLLAGEPDETELAATDAPAAGGRPDRAAGLEEAVAALRDEVASLRADLDEVRKELGLA